MLLLILAATVVISLNNAGVIGSANKEVEASNLKNVKSAADLVYSDYLINKPTVEDLGEYLTQNLKDSGTITGEDYYIKMNGKETAVVKVGSLVDKYYKGEVNVGDYVDYDAGSNSITVDSHQIDYVQDPIQITSKSDSIVSTSNIKWRVLGAEGASLLLVSEEEIKTSTNSRLVLYGAEDYLYAKEILDNACSVFGKGDGAVKARSIKIEDVEQYSSFDKTQYEYLAGINLAGHFLVIPYGTELHYDGKSSVNFEIRYFSGSTYRPNMRIISYPDKTKTGYINTGECIQQMNAYYYTAQNYFSNSVVYNMLFKTLNNTNSSYWLASNSVGGGPEFAYFNVRTISGGAVSTSELYKGGSDGQYDLTYYESGDYNIAGEYYIRPVVSLNENIMGDKVNTIWELK